MYSHLVHVLENDFYSKAYRKFVIANRNNDVYLANYTTTADYHGGGDPQLRHMVEWIGTLKKKYGRRILRSVKKKILLIFTADHGGSEFSHASNRASEIRVPLILMSHSKPENRLFDGPEFAKVGDHNRRGYTFQFEKHHSRHVSMIDIVPTIVDALYGVSNEHGLLETEPALRGRSLLRYLSRMQHTKHTVMNHRFYNEVHQVG